MHRVGEEEEAIATRNVFAERVMRSAQTREPCLEGHPFAWAPRRVPSQVREKADVPSMGQAVRTRLCAAKMRQAVLVATHLLVAFADEEDKPPTSSIVLRDRLSSDLASGRAQSLSLTPTAAVWQKRGRTERNGPPCTVVQHQQGTREVELEVRP